MFKKKLHLLIDRISHFKKCLVAVSGGVDSMTLGYLCNIIHGKSAIIIHSISPAVPDFATKRVQDFSNSFHFVLEEKVYYSFHLGKYSPQQ